MTKAWGRLLGLVGRITTTVTLQMCLRTLPRGMPSLQRLGGHDQPVSRWLGPAGRAVHLAAHLDAGAPVSSCCWGSAQAGVS